MLELMIAAPASGSGKTMVTAALLAALKRRGLAPCAFKCGPDYIDPLFHRAVLGVQSHNLDLFLGGAATVRTLYARYSRGAGAAVCEGVMGYYDGLGGATDAASSWHLADTLALPVLLVLRPKGASLTLAATVRGLLNFRPNSHIAGILLNDCAPMLHAALAPMLEREAGLPVLGYLPHRAEAVIESRHLGLRTAGEIADIAARIDVMADQLERSVDIPRLLALFSGRGQAAPPVPSVPPPAARIAVARDEAFSFVYEETLDALRLAGAELVFFSPLRDAALPDKTGGLYLPGGYPELYAGALSANAPMRAAVRAAVQGGLPTVAECGGFLYLCESLEAADGRPWPMAAALPGRGVKTEKLVRFGYMTLTARADSLLFARGARCPAHEFHYWDCTENGAALHAEKPVSGRGWDCCVTGPTLYAGFPHLYFAGSPTLARRFVQGAVNYGEGVQQ